MTRRTIPRVSGLTIAPAGWAQGDDARWHRIDAVAGFPKSDEPWLAACSTGAQVNASAFFEGMPTGGVCPTCRASDGDS